MNVSKLQIENCSGAKETTTLTFRLQHLKRFPLKFLKETFTPTPFKGNLILFIQPTEKTPISELRPNENPIKARTKEKHKGNYNFSKSRELKGAQMVEDTGKTQFSKLRPN